MKSEGGATRTALTYAQLFDAQLFEAVDGSNVEFRVFLASLEYSDPSVWLTDTAAILKAADGK